MQMSVRWVFTVSPNKPSCACWGGGLIVLTVLSCSQCLAALSGVWTWFSACRVQIRWVLVCFLVFFLLSYVCVEEESWEVGSRASELWVQGTYAVSQHLRDGASLVPIFWALGYLALGFVCAALLLSGSFARLGCECAGMRGRRAACAYLQGAINWRAVVAKCEVKNQDGCWSSMFPLNVQSF